VVTDPLSDRKKLSVCLDIAERIVIIVDLLGFWYVSVRRKQLGQGFEDGKALSEEYGVAHNVLYKLSDYTSHPITMSWHRIQLLLT
jgi:hypothetical protein